MDTVNVENTGDQMATKIKISLYYLTTVELGGFYILDKDPTSAITKLQSMLDKTDYGFTKGRKVKNVEILAEEITDFPENTPNFSSGNNLIL